MSTYTTITHDLARIRTRKIKIETVGWAQLSTVLGKLESNSRAYRYYTGSVNYCCVFKGKKSTKNALISKAFSESFLQFVFENYISVVRSLISFSVQNYVRNSRSTFFYAVLIYLTSAVLKMSRPYFSPCKGKNYVIIAFKPPLYIHMQDSLYSRLI